MRVAVLLLHESHFAQALPVIKKYPAKDVVVIPLDTYSLNCVKEFSCRFFSLEYKHKAAFRRKLLRRMPLIIESWGDADIKEVKLKEYLKVKDFDLWKILKSEIAVQLFDKLYFLELAKYALSQSGAGHLILPKFPSMIQLSYLATVNRKTLVSLAESMGIEVLDKIKR